MLSEYKDKTVFVEDEFQVFVAIEQRKVPVTFDVGKVALCFCVTCYQTTCITCQRTGGKETKVYPRIHIPTHYANWGYPKRKSRVSDYDINQFEKSVYRLKVVCRGRY